MTAPTSAAVEAVALRLAFGWDATAWTSEFSDDRRDYWRAKATGAIAAVLDNMPRGVMARALRREVPQICPFSLEAIDATIAAARKELLGHD